MFTLIIAQYKFIIYYYYLHRLSFPDRSLVNASCACFTVSFLVRNGPFGFSLIYGNIFVCPREPIFFCLSLLEALPASIFTIELNTVTYQTPCWEITTSGKKDRSTQKLAFFRRLHQNALVKELKFVIEGFEISCHDRFFCLQTRVLQISCFPLPSFSHRVTH